MHCIPRRLLLARSSASARLDAELLLEHVTGLSRTNFRAAPERELPAAGGLVVSATGQAAPAGRARCIHPRSAGILVAAARSDAGRADSAAGNRARGRAGAGACRRPDATGAHCDLGTGSGAIALAIASERPALHDHRRSMRPARRSRSRARNAARLQLGNVRFAHGSWFAPLAGQRFDVDRLESALRRARTIRTSRRRCAASNPASR